MPFLGVQPSRGLVGTAGIDADAITSAKIADDQIDSEHYAAGSIDTAHIALNQIDGTLTKDALIADYSDVTITASDLIMYGDQSDSNNTKRDTVQGILDLASGASTAGNLTQIGATQTASNDGYIEFTSAISTTYDRFIFKWNRVIPATDGASLRMQWSTDNGSNWIDNNEYGRSALETDENSNNFVGGVNQAYIQCSSTVESTASDGGNFGFVELFDPTENIYPTCYGRSTGASNDQQVTQFIFAGATWTQQDVDAVKFVFSSGNIASGEFKLFGVVK